MKTATRVRAGFYRCGPYCIHRGRWGWGIYCGPDYLKSFATLADAIRWCLEA